MTARVLIIAFALWPVLAFAGGLAFSTIVGLAALAVIPAAREIKLRSYMGWLAAFVAFAAVSVAWSPEPFDIVEFRPLDGVFNVRSDVLRVGLLLFALAVLLTAASRLGDRARSQINSVAAIAISVQLVCVGLLAAFESQALDLFAPMMSAPAEGVQNITRNSLILVVATPWLYFAIREWRSDRIGDGLSIAAVAVVAAALAWRGVHAGLLALVLAAVCIAVVRYAPRHGFKILGCGLAVIIALTPWIFGLISIGADIETTSSSMGWRRAIWSRVLEIVADSPLYGGGVGVMRTIDDQIAAGAFAGDRLVPNHAHNMFVQLWVETGAAGAAMVVVVILLAAWRAPAPERIGVTGQMAAGVIGAAVGVMAVTYDLWNDWWWAVAGLLLALVTLSLSRDSLSQLSAASQRPVGGVSPERSPVYLTHELSNNFNLLRLLFAASVAIYHICLIGGAGGSLTTETGALTLAASIGVHGFFVLSGYLVYASCERARSTKSYALKRVRRLYPAYFVVIIATVAGALIFSAEARANQSDVIAYMGWNLVFLNFVHPELPGLFQGGEITAVNGALWTLKIEVMFYASLPFLVWLFNKAGRFRWMVAAGLYALSEIWRLALMGAAETGAALSPWYDTLAYQFPGQLRFFICGIMLYWLRRERDLMLWLAPFGVAALAISIATPDSELLRPISLALVVFWVGLVLPRLVDVTRYGDISYGLYIVHFPIAQALASVGGQANAPWAFIYANVSISLAAAMVLWWTVERPFLHRESAYRMTSRDPENVLQFFKYRVGRHPAVRRDAQADPLSKGA